MSRKTVLLTAVGSLASLLFGGCGGGSAMSSSPPAYEPITISLSSSATTAPFNGVSPTLTVAGAERTVRESVAVATGPPSVAFTIAE